jgi:hypothetical protein
VELYGSIRPGGGRLGQGAEDIPRKIPAHRTVSSRQTAGGDIKTGSLTIPIGGGDNRGGLKETARARRFPDPLIEYFPLGRVCSDLFSLEMILLPILRTAAEPTSLDQSANNLAVRRIFNGSEITCP